LRVEACKNSNLNPRWLLGYVKHWVASKGRGSILLILLLSHSCAKHLRVRYWNIIDEVEDFVKSIHAIVSMTIPYCATISLYLHFIIEKRKRVETRSHLLVGFSLVFGFLDHILCSIVWIVYSFACFFHFDFNYFHKFEHYTNTIKFKI